MKQNSLMGGQKLRWCSVVSHCPEIFDHADNVYQVVLIDGRIRMRLDLLRFPLIKWCKRKSSRTTILSNCLRVEAVSHLNDGLSNLFPTGKGRNVCLLESMKSVWSGIFS